MIISALGRLAYGSVCEIYFSWCGSQCVTSYAKSCCAISMNKNTIRLNLVLPSSTDYNWCALEQLSRMCAYEYLLVDCAVVSSLRYQNLKFISMQVNSSFATHGDRRARIPPDKQSVPVIIHPNVSSLLNAQMMSPPRIRRYPNWMWLERSRWRRQSIQCEIEPRTTYMKKSK